MRQNGPNGRGAHPARCGNLDPRRPPLPGEQRSATATDERIWGSGRTFSRGAPAGGGPARLGACGSAGAARRLPAARWSALRIGWHHRDVSFLVRVVVNALALAVAAWLLPGISVTGPT